MSFVDRIITTLQEVGADYKIFVQSLMTLDGALSAVDTRVADLESAGGGGSSGPNFHEVPFYVHDGQPELYGKDYDPKYGTYNWTPQTSRKVRGGNNRATNGTGELNIFVISDSSMLDYSNGSTIQAEGTIPKRMIRNIANALGVQVRPGIIPCLQGANLKTDAWTFAGSYDMGTYPGLVTLNTGGSATFVGNFESGTRVELLYATGSVVGNIVVDGGTAQNTPAAQTPSVMGKYLHPSTFAEGPHTITINSPNGYMFIFGLRIYTPGAAGAVVHNMAVGGSRAVGGGAWQDWGDTISAITLQSTYKRALELSGITPDLVLWSLGPNEMYANEDPTIAANSIKQMIQEWWPTAANLMIQGAGIQGGNEMAWDSYTRQKYQIAQDLDVGLIDLRPRLGGSPAEAANLGYIGPDGLHFSTGGMTDIARLLADIIAGPEQSRPAVVKPFSPKRRIVATTAREFILSDAGAIVDYNKTSNDYFTIPLNSKVPFEIGTEIEGTQLNTGQAWFQGASGVTIVSAQGTKTAAQWATYGLRKVDINTWLLYGRTTT